jgi:O-antigen ligase
MAIVLVSGVLGAEGARWLTLVRELIIGLSFFAAIVGVAAVSRDPNRLQAVLAGVAFVLVVSSAASLLALVTQKLYPFETPIAGFIPDSVASTRLGELTFTDRSLGTWSYFLGRIFVRPQGLFLFSTSQAVAQASAIPILLAAGIWFPFLRRWFWFATALSAAALLATTTRTPIAALAVCLLAVGILYLARRGGGGAWIGRHRTSLIAGGIVVGGLLTVAVGSGAAGTALRGLTARSVGPRADLYVATLERWAERPLLGWGTEIDWVQTDGEGQVPSQPPGQAAVEDAANSPPLGSHSHYLGVLFKQGILGLLVFAFVLWMLVEGVRRQVGSRALGPMLVAAGVVTTLVSGLTESLWLDPGAALFVAMAWGLVLAPPMPEPITFRTRQSPAPASATTS